MARLPQTKALTSNFHKLSQSFNLCHIFTVTLPIAWRASADRGCKNPLDCTHREAIETNTTTLTILQGGTENDS